MNINEKFRPTKKFERLCKGLTFDLRSVLTAAISLYATIFGALCWPNNRLHVFLPGEPSSKKKIKGSVYLENRVNDHCSVLNEEDR